MTEQYRIASGELEAIRASVVLKNYPEDVQFYVQTTWIRVLMT
jgi:hypothetical protein